MSCSPSSDNSGSPPPIINANVFMRNLKEEGNIALEDGEKIFDPYNIKNVVITEEDVLNILKAYGLKTKVHNIKLYQRAFIHRSYIKKPEFEIALDGITLAEKPDDCLPLFQKSNERLEYLGDGVLEMVVKYYLYRRFPKAEEGFMTQKKIDLVKNEHIGKLALEMGLNKWFIISNVAEETKVRYNLKKLGCLFEAFIGAIFLDNNKYGFNDQQDQFNKLTDEDDLTSIDHFITGHGFNYAQQFIEAVLEKHVDWHALIATDTNYKMQVQIKIQRAFKTTPYYLPISDTRGDEDLPEGDVGAITMGIYICLNQPIYQADQENAELLENVGGLKGLRERFENNIPVMVLAGQATHSTKKRAEQQASENALNTIIEFE